MNSIITSQSKKYLLKKGENFKFCIIRLSLSQRQYKQMKTFQDLKCNQVRKKQWKLTGYYYKMTGKDIKFISYDYRMFILIFLNENEQVSTLSIEFNKFM
jgi:hypothetical protein